MNFAIIIPLISVILAARRRKYRIVLFTYSVISISVEALFQFPEDHQYHQQRNVF